MEALPRRRDERPDQAAATSAAEHARSAAADDELVLALIEHRRRRFAAEATRLCATETEARIGAPARRTDSGEVPGLLPEPVSIGAWFPLVRCLVGSFDEHPAGRPPHLFRESVHHHGFVTNSVALCWKDLDVQIDTSFTIQTSTHVGRFHATPFVPAEGYQPSPGDLDLDARMTQLAAAGYSPYEWPVDTIYLPVSPGRLRAHLHATTPDPRITDLAHTRRRNRYPDFDAAIHYLSLHGLTLELEFAGAIRYTALGEWSQGHLRGDHFAPSELGPLASSSEVPAGLALFMPPTPELLTTVRARLIDAPDAHVRFRDVPYSGPRHLQHWPAATLRALDPTLGDVPEPNTVPLGPAWPGRTWQVDDDNRPEALSALVTWCAPTGHRHTSLGTLFVGDHTPRPVLGMLIELDGYSESGPAARLTPDTVAAAATAFMRRSDGGAYDEDARLIRDLTDPAAVCWIVEQRLIPPDYSRAERSGTSYRVDLRWDPQHDRYSYVPNSWGPLTDTEYDLLGSVDVYYAEDLIWDMDG